MQCVCVCIFGHNRRCTKKASQIFVVPTHKTRDVISLAVRFYLLMHTRILIPNRNAAMSPRSTKSRDFYWTLLNLASWSLRKRMRSLICSTWQSTLKNHTCSSIQAHSSQSKSTNSKRMSLPINADRILPGATLSRVREYVRLDGNELSWLPPRLPRSLVGLNLQSQLSLYTLDTYIYIWMRYLAI